MSRVSDEVVARERERALRILAVVRAHGARFYREYMSIRESPTQDDAYKAVLPVGTHVFGPTGFVAPGALATLADVALASSIRPHIRQRARTVTVGLTMQFISDRPTQAVHARAEICAVDSHMGLSQCRLTDDQGGLLALATGLFAIRPVPDAAPWLPYSRDAAIAHSSVPPLDPSELDAEERWLLEHLENSLRSDGPDGPYANYLGIEWQARGMGRSEGIWRLRSHVWNRVTHVHGGAMFGGLAAVALACLPDSTKVRVAEQHVQFVRPGQGEALHVKANVVRQGARLTSVQSAVTDKNGEVVANALVTLEGIADGEGIRNLRHRNSA